MSIINVPDTDTFDIWRTKFNSLANQVGDLTLLTTPVTTDIVSAINSIVASNEDELRALFIRSIAMA